MCVCAAAATSARWRDAGLSPLTRRRREGSPADAPAVRSAVTAVPTRPRIISRTALRRAIGPRTPGAHVKVLVSHDASEGPLSRVAARRRCVSARGSKFMAAAVGWRSLASLSRLVRAQYSLSRQANLASGETLAPKNAAIQTIPCTWCRRGRRLSKARDARNSTALPGSSGTVASRSSLHALPFPTTHWGST